MILVDSHIKLKLFSLGINAKVISNNIGICVILSGRRSDLVSRLEVELAAAPKYEKMFQKAMRLGFQNHILYTH